MNKAELIELLSDEPMRFTKTELREMMEEELNKDPSEMDTDFVDLCAEILVGQCAEATQINRKRPQNENARRFKRILLAAAVIAVLLSIAVPVSAKYTDNGISEKIVEFYSDYFKLNLRRGDTEAEHYSEDNADLLNALRAQGIENVILPSALTKEACIEGIQIESAEEFTTVQINFADKDVGVNGYMAIAEYTHSFDNIGQMNALLDFDHIKQISVNGLDVIVYGGSTGNFIKYIDRNTLYTIFLKNCDFEVAVEIADTLR